MNFVDYEIIHHNSSYKVHCDYIIEIDLEYVIPRHITLSHTYTQTHTTLTIQIRTSICVKKVCTLKVSTNMVFI